MWEAWSRKIPSTLPRTAATAQPRERVHRRSHGRHLQRALTRLAEVEPDDHRAPAFRRKTPWQAITSATFLP
jgi:hypothetical protein